MNTTCFGQILGALFSEPVIYEPVVTSTEMSILSFKNDLGIILLGMKSWFDNFDQNVCSCLITIFLLTISAMDKNKKIYQNIY